MALGDGTDDAALNAAWSEFCDRLKAAGERVFKDLNSASGLQRADGFRFLTQNLGQAFDLALETKDTRYPAIHTFCNPTRKLGGDCADFVYQQAWIDGESTYRIIGDRGTARFLNITVQGPRSDGPGVLHEPFGDVPEANLFGDQLTTAPDGSFEIYVGGEQRGPNWLPTTGRFTKAVHPPGFRLLGRAAGANADRACRHGCPQTAAHPGVDDRRDGLGGWIRHGPDGRLAGVPVPLRRGGR